MPEPPKISDKACLDGEQPRKELPENAAPELEALRIEIDRIDRALTQLVKERIALVSHVAEIKERLGLPTRDSEREKQVMAKVATEADDPDLLVLFEGLYARLFELSREYQKTIRARLKSGSADDKPSLKTGR